MLVAAGDTLTTSLVTPPGLIGTLGARIEVPVTRAIVSYWVPGTLTGSVWTVSIAVPVTPGDYQLVWLGDADQYTAFVPLTIVSPADMPGGGTDYPRPDLGRIRPTTAEVATLEKTRTIDDNNVQQQDFTSTTDPTAAEVDTLIDLATTQVLSQLPRTFSEKHYDEVSNAVALYAAVLIETSHFREQVDRGAVATYRQLLKDSLAALYSDMESERHALYIAGAATGAVLH